MLITVRQQIFDVAYPKRREAYLRSVQTVSYNKIDKMWQVVHDIRQSVEMIGRCEKNTARGQIDHPAQGWAAKGAVHRNLDKFELLQRI